MTDSSRRRALTWPYPRHIRFEEQLRASNATWFKEHGCTVDEHRHYILDQWKDWPKNIIIREVAEYVQHEFESRIANDKNFPLHKYLHHGLSSQAMLFNLVGPLIVRGDLAPLQKAFEETGIDWPTGCVTPEFEVENREIFNEDTGQPTSIDLAIRGESGNQSLYIEAKLVEHEFGGCSVFEGGDCDGRNPSGNFEQCYLHHIGRRYWLLLEKYGFLDRFMFSSPICPFVAYYQYFRELLFAIESGGDFVLLYDRRNPTFYCGTSPNERGLMPFLETFVPKSLRSRIHSVSIQKVVATYKAESDFEWLPEFERKYNLIAAIRSPGI